MTEFITQITQGPNYSKLNDVETTISFKPIPYIVCWPHGKHLLVFLHCTSRQNETNDHSWGRTVFVRILQQPRGIFLASLFHRP